MTDNNQLRRQLEKKIDEKIAKAKTDYTVIDDGSLQGRRLRATKNGENFDIPIMPSINQSQQNSY